MSSINPEWYRSWMSQTKGAFGILTTTMTQLWAPTVMYISGDRSVRGQIIQTDSNEVYCDFPDRLVLVANHQIYTDWLYLWWIAYTAGRHSNVYIVLKESLKRIPVVGWGMQLNKFIFLRRDWQHDRLQLRKHMQRLDRLVEPMWLMLFPEGTNLAPSTREKSARWAAKKRLPDMQHTLLPRTTGLRFCLLELRGSVEWVYDCTVAYDGVARGQYAHDVFPLPAAYLEGRPPRAVSMYWRRFHVRDIPLDSPLAFESWLLARWREKDRLIEYWYRNGGRFPADRGVELGSKGEFLRGAGMVEARVKASRWQDFFRVLAPVSVLALLLFLFYGALPKDAADVIASQATAMLGGGGDGEGSNSIDAAKPVKKPAGSKKLLAFNGQEWQHVDEREPVSPESSKATASVAAKVPGKAKAQKRPGDIRERLDPKARDSKGSSLRSKMIANERPPRKMLGFSGGQLREVPSSTKASSIASEPNGDTLKVGLAPKLNPKPMTSPRTERNRKESSASSVVSGLQDGQTLLLPQSGKGRLKTPPKLAPRTAPSQKSLAPI